MSFNLVKAAFWAGAAAASQNISDIPWQCDCDQIDVPADDLKEYVERCKQRIDVGECTKLIKLAEAVGLKDFPLDHPNGYDPRRSATIGCLSCWPGVSNIAIDWNGLDLQGSIPSLIGEMTWLTRVDLGNNNLSGPIPTMPSAYYLNLVSNRLSGGYPSGSWPELWTMFLGGNQLTGSLPQGLDKSMPKLRRLDISNNHFTGEIPSDMSIWKPDMYCDLCEFGGNQWSSSIPPWWMENTTIWNTCCGDLHCLGARVELQV